MDLPAPVADSGWLWAVGGKRSRDQHKLYHHPPLDELGFLAFARSLPAPDVFNIIAKAEAVSEIIPHMFPSSLRRHYEEMTCFPKGRFPLSRNRGKKGSQRRCAQCRYHQSPPCYAPRSPGAEGVPQSDEPHAAAVQPLPPQGADPGAAWRQAARAAKAAGARGNWGSEQVGTESRRLCRGTWQDIWPAPPGLQSAAKPPPLSDRRTVQAEAGQAGGRHDGAKRNPGLCS